VRRAARGLALALLVLLAAAVGTVAGFVHRSAVDVGPVSLPLGMLAVLGSLVALLLLVRRVGRSRLATGLVAAAYALPVLVESQFRPEGDLVVAQDGWGMTLLGASALIITIALVVPPGPYHELQAAPGGAPPPHETAEP
jgi:hypothetical protein